ncbi:hypothetical protein KL935_000833 [Ogataea polymorpha]|uniref:ATP11-domain-containing protein n=1 Tax=Ogataea polymorpha TaxID=460523 RepID=A0A9P8PDK9_9ASCO|nr:hypothetical protein KL935_000833 [Ogataea polymorpha]KAG7920143.1 hypothetical protein KL927_000823 [Ogataea polymorpha]KAH3669907.1 hypothetical protein OGATHE_002719 [Ogataea polymorpha]
MFLRPRCFFRTARVTPVRFVASKAIEKDVAARYKEKLDRKARELGAANAEQLKEKLKDEIEKKKLEMNKIDPLKELEAFEKAQQNKVRKNVKERSPIDPSTPKDPYKTLNSYLDLEKIKGLKTNEIEFLWRMRFQKGENTLSAVVPTSTFDRLFNNAIKNPTFVLPLPREDAQAESEDKGNPVEIHFVQWNFVGPNTTHVLITSLAEYKLHQEYARPHTTVMFHQELKEDKGIVMMNGQVEKDASVTLQEAQLLLLNVQRFYGGLAETTSESNQKRLELLRKFNSGDPAFSMEELIELAERMEN